MTTIASFIRDEALKRIKGVTQWKTVRKVPIPPLQPDQVTALGVFMLRESLTAEGDANVGPPKYISDFVLAISVVDSASKPEVMEGSVDTLVEQILDTLLCDPSFVSLVDSQKRQIIDSIPQITRTYSFPQNGETYYLECRLQMTIRYFVNFPPNTPTALTAVTITPTSQPANGSAVMEIDLPQ